MKKITEIQAINGPYPPTGEGIYNALENAQYDQGLGTTAANDHITVVFDDGSTQGFGVPAKGELAFRAAEIAHELGIEHDQSACAGCALEEMRTADELAELEKFADTLVF